jgi:hypothetical protein
MELIDVFDASKVNELARDLDGQSLMPLDYAVMDPNQRSQLRTNNLTLMLNQAASGASVVETGTEYPHLSSSDVIIVPSSLKESAANIRSIAVGVKDGPEARQLAKELSKRLGFPIYFGDENGVHVVSSTPLLPQAPKSLFIPLLIACLIIFNTMLSSVAERKREIHIYTSLGLAPLHIGVLFLAEAVTYGMMGSIFGYIVGQGVATLISNFGWLGGITLNYSGTQAIGTMLMVLAVVILSSLVPAYMAGKMAVPSTDRTWKVPEPDGDIIRDTLPFTFTQQTANGLTTFLHEFLDAHREGSIGNFSSDNIELFICHKDPVKLMGIRAVIWLAPYDLGVRQDVGLRVRPTDEEDVLELDIDLIRSSGQTKTWWKLNKVFLGDLRKQLLGWRKLKAWRIMQYVEQGDHTAQTIK